MSHHTCLGQQIDFCTFAGKDLVGFTNVVLFNTREGESNIGVFTIIMDVHEHDDKREGHPCAYKLQNPGIAKILSVYRTIMYTQEALWTLR